MTDNKVFWERWAKRYDGFMAGSRRTYGEVVRRMKHSLNRNMTVLELACGSELIFDIPEDVAKLGYAPTSRMLINAGKLHSLGWVPEYDLPQMFERLLASMRAWEKE